MLSTTRRVWWQCKNGYLTAARSLQVSIRVVEQSPALAGATLHCLLDAAGQPTVVSKTRFSACEALGDIQGTILLCGIEAHTCVLQTAFELLEAGRHVLVVADAIGSRQLSDRDYAIARLRDVGVGIVSGEMVLAEWLRGTDSPVFEEARVRLLQTSPALRFNEVLSTLPRIDHLAGLQLWRDGRLETLIENKPGQAGSLAVYHALFQRFGAITPKAARAGQWLYGEHAADARVSPGKHPNIDRLFGLETLGGGYGVRLLLANTAA